MISLDGLTGSKLDRGVAKLGRQTVQNLGSSQKGEIWAMKQMGVDRADIRAERQANQQEKLGLRNTMAGMNAQNYQTFQTPNMMTAQTQNPMAGKVADLLKQAQETRTKYNMADLYNKDSRTQTGFGINHLVKPLYWQQQDQAAMPEGQTAQYRQNNPFGAMMNRATAQWDNNALTAEQVARANRAGVARMQSIKPVKGQEGLYRVARNYGQGDDIHRIYDFYTKNDDGTYKNQGYDRYKYDAPSKKSGLGTMLGVAGLAAFGMPMLGISGLATPSLAGATIGGISANTVGSLASSAASMGVK